MVDESRLIFYNLTAEHNGGVQGPKPPPMSTYGGAIVYLFVSAFNFCVAAASNGSVDFEGLASYLPSD